MKCPTPGCPGHLRCRSTRESSTPGRTIRYRRCDTCGGSWPKLEHILAQAIPTGLQHCKPSARPTK